MNKRRSKLLRVGNSVGVVIPPDWVRGMDLQPGDELEVLYDGVITVRKPRPPVEPDASE